MNINSSSKNMHCSIALILVPPAMYTSTCSCTARGDQLVHLVEATHGLLHQLFHCSHGQVEKADTVGRGHGRGRGHGHGLGRGHEPKFFF